MAQTSTHSSAAEHVSAPSSGGVRGLVRRALHDPRSLAYRRTLVVILVAILTSVIALVLETVHPLHEDYLSTFVTIDYALLVLFTVEYASNIWVASNRRAYLFSIWGVIDFLSIAPSFLALLDVSGTGGTLIPGVNIGFLRELRILRVLRMLKLMKLASERAAESSANAKDRNTFWLDIQIYLICLFTVLVISATVVYHIEPYPVDAPVLSEALKLLADDAGPVTDAWASSPMIPIYKARADQGWPLPTYTFDNVPMTVWWAFVTLTTTGYGDMYPVTGIGRFAGALTMFAGLALFSLLTSVVGRTLMRSLFGRQGDGDPQAAERRAKLRALLDSLRLLAPPALPGSVGSTRVRDDDQPTDLTTVFSAPSLAGFGEAARVIARETVEATGGRQIDTAKPVATDSVLTRVLRLAFVDERSELFAWVRRVLTVLIFASIGIVILNSVSEVHEALGPTFEMFEIAMVVLFSMEYLSYLYLATNKRAYVFGFWGLVDLFAILPTYLTLVLALSSTFGMEVDLSHGIAFKIIRILRVLRMLRVLKLMKSAVTSAQATMSGKQSSFWMDLQIYFIALLTVLTMSSTLIYTIEVDQTGTQFINIPVAMWWAVVTITTTGYGDMFPITLAGRVVAMGTMIAGLALFGILTSVVGRALMSSLFGSSGEDTDGDGDLDGGEPLDDALRTVESLTGQASPSPVAGASAK
ncbi:MAG: ion transporter [Chloroflexi bacterium]|nr:ion transporter [Chloroflexota bacterium]